jgi:cellulose synthase/poly-beta-1,6-N-acetylglucosamine synthase-like glycosyltransferase
MMLLILIIIFLLISLTIAVYNLFSAPVFRRTGVNGNNSTPLVSVLIPARNEESNISECLDSLSKQDYRNIEVIAGNDNSSDNTSLLIDQFADKFSFIRKIEIPLLPEGWSGKNFAADTLYRNSHGNLILFIDADVTLDRSAISSAVNYMNNYNADVLSVFPSQDMKGIGEKIVVPLLNFFLLSLLPLIKVYKSNNISLSAGIGQFILFRRSAYEITGGHKAVKNKVAEDLELIRSAKRNRLKVLTLLDEGLVSCRMYNGFTDAVNGFTKNFFRGTSLPVVLFIIFLTVYITAFFSPFLLVFFNPGYLLPLFLILVIRLSISIRSRQPLTDLLLHPVQMITFYMIGIRSVIYGDKVKWKGRSR